MKTRLAFLFLLPFALLLACGTKSQTSETQSAFMPNKWPNGQVYYQIDTQLPAEQISEIQKAIDYWRTWTPIKFSEKSANDPNYIFFTSVEDSCYSKLGMQGGQQLIRCDLRAGKGWNYGSLIHEIGHAVGMVHEHTRIDRDDYISIDWSNIKDDANTRYQYEIQRSSTAYSAYDFYSIMHYHSFAPSNANDKNLPLFKKLSNKTVSNNYYNLSPGDIQGIHVAYGNQGMAPGVATWIKSNAPALLVGDVRNNNGYLYAVFDSNQTIPWDAGDRQATPLGLFSWQTCAPNYTFVAQEFNANGFWVCARNDLINTGKEFFLGDTVNNLGNYYQIKLSPNSTVKKLGDRLWQTCDGQTKLASIDFTKEGFWTCSIRNEVVESSYYAYVGLVRSNAGSLFAVNKTSGVNSVSVASWNTCENGSVLVGTSFEPDGFWLCASPERKDQAFYVGNVVRDRGKLYRVQGGNVQLVSDASWNTCPSSRLFGTYFNSNGVWICGE